MTQNLTKILFLSIVLSLFGCQKHDDIDAYLDQLYQEGKLNGNLLVIKDAKTLIEKSFGYADGSKTTKLTKNYRFNIGSVYKEFPAVAIMQLVEKNIINLDDKISKHIPELPQWAETISIKHLLQYSSGLPKVSWDEYFSKGININDSILINDLHGIEKLEFEPGLDYLYSNNNPILLIRIVEKVSGLNFNDYIQKNIFNPLNMSGTVIKGQYPYIDRTLMAIPFNKDFVEDDYKLSVKSLLFSSTARDMARWLKQLEGFKVVGKPSVKALSEKAKVGDNIQAPLGRCHWEGDQIIEHFHHGSSANYECVVRRFKQDQITIIILTNQKHGNVSEISEEIYKIITQKM